MLATATAHAQTSPPPSFPTRFVGLSPAFQEVSAPPGAAATATLHLVNLGPSPVQIEFSLEDLAPSGAPRPAGTLPTSLAGHISLPSPITLAPLISTPVSITVTGTESTRMGIVVARTAGGGVAIGARLVVTPPRAAPSVSGALTASPSGAITLTLSNAGTGSARLAGSVYLTRGDDFIGRLQVPPTILLPGGSVTLPLPWPRPLPSGTLTRAVLTDGAGHLITLEAPLIP
jgi:hypothetical protein